MAGPASPVGSKATAMLKGVPLTLLRLVGDHFCSVIVRGFSNRAFMGMRGKEPHDPPGIVRFAQNRM